MDIVYFVCWVIFLFFCHLIFFIFTFSKIAPRNAIRVLYSLDPDQAQH